MTGALAASIGRKTYRAKKMGKLSTGARRAAAMADRVKKGS